MSVNIDYDRCRGCEFCYRECPADVFTWDKEKDLPIIARQNECWHCGICVLECPEDAMVHTLPPQCWNDTNKRFLANIGGKKSP